MLKFNSDIVSLIYSMNIDQREKLSNLFKDIKSDGLDSSLIQFTFDDIIEKIDSITNYENRKAEVENLVSVGKTSIPESRWGVHNTHCCNDHGCKYGDIDCPVTLGLSKQVYKCEDCEV